MNTIWDSISENNVEKKICPIFFVANILTNISRSVEENHTKMLDNQATQCLTTQCAMWRTTEVTGKIIKNKENKDIISNTGLQIIGHCGLVQKPEILTVKEIK